MVGGAGFHQRQRLQGFNRRTRVNQGIDIAPGVQNASLRIAHRDGAAMAVFDDVATGRVDQDWIGHKPDSVSLVMSKS